jgi:Peptidase MA superfamily
MGRLARSVLPFLVLAVGMGLLAPAATLGFSGFGSTSADATYGAQMRFTVQLPGGPPEKLELLLQFTGSDSTFVAPVEAGANSAEYIWDATARPLTPNTAVTYRWRATDHGTVTLSSPGHLLYDDNRPGLNWQSARIGQTTVHWYGGAESQARHFGAISADAASAAEALLGHTLDGPIDIFVYATRDDFFGALGPGAREWTGAATYPSLRTIFMWLGGGSSGYLETTMTHEVTHVVFYDATRNPFHEPAKWFNEGLAVWSEQQSAGSRAAEVRSAAASGDLLAFDGIAESFPIGDQAARLSYAEGATMVQMIIDSYGRGAIAAIAAAYRSGDGDAEALEAGTGTAAAQLYADYFRSFGVSPPTAVEPDPILPSNVSIPPQPAAAEPSQPSSSTPSAAGDVGQSGSQPLTPVLIAAGLVTAGLATLVVLRRRSRSA